MYSLFDVFDVFQLFDVFESFSMYCRFDVFKLLTFSNLMGVFVPSLSRNITFGQLYATLSTVFEPFLMFFCTQILKIE